MLLCTDQLGLMVQYHLIITDSFQTSFKLISILILTFILIIVKKSQSYPPINGLEPV